ncbi:MAG: 50S ribosomal protein L6 [bacterium]
MSRLGKYPVVFGEKTSVEIKDGKIFIKGEKGSLERVINNKLDYDVSDKEILIKRRNDEKESKALHGLFRSLINNMVVGVEKGFEKELVINGTGYRFGMKGKQLECEVGYSSPVIMDVPESVDVEISKKGDSMKLKSVNNEVLGDFCAKIRKLRPVEPYKAKGIHFKDERIRRKVGKAAAGAE